MARYGRSNTGRSSTLVAGRHGCQGSGVRRPRPVRASVRWAWPLPGGAAWPPWRQAWPGRCQLFRRWCYNAPVPRRPGSVHRRRERVTSSYLLLGATYAFAAAVQPGPFQTYLISSTLTHGWRRTAPAVLAPILSDIPIVCLVLLVLTRVPPLAVELLRLSGGLFVLYLAAGGGGGLPQVSGARERSAGGRQEDGYPGRPSSTCSTPIRISRGRWYWDRYCCRRGGRRRCTPSRSWGRSTPRWWLPPL